VCTQFPPAPTSGHRSATRFQTEYFGRVWRKKIASPVCVRIQSRYCTKSAVCGRLRPKKFFQRLWGSGDDIKRFAKVSQRV
jgi:hypothetical protein